MSNHCTKVFWYPYLIPLERVTVDIYPAMHLIYVVLINKIPGNAKDKGDGLYSLSRWVTEVSQLMERSQKLCSVFVECSLSWYWLIGKVGVKIVLIYRTMHHTAKRAFELSNILGLGLPKEIAISLTFMTSFPAMFAKGMKAETKQSKTKPKATAAIPQADTKVLISDSFFFCGQWLRMWRAVTTDLFPLCLAKRQMH